MSEDELDFDFGAWCPVCDRAILPPAEPLVPPSDPPVSPNSSTGARSKKSLASSHGAGTKKDGLTTRRKSSTKLHHANGPRHQRAHSHSNLTTLTASTSIHPAAQPPTPAVPPETDPAVLRPPSSLYCSEECRRIDELRSRLAFADLGPVPSNTSSNALDWSRRRSSASSHYDLSLGPGTSGTSFAPTSLPHMAAPSLDFSTRRNSRGSEGAYSYRPSLMQRVPSSEDGASLNGWGRSRGSTDSLASMGEADERSERGYAVRPPSALSALRFMTPISAVGPVHSKQRIGHRPPPLSRHHTDAPRATTFRTDEELDGSTDSDRPVRRKSGKLGVDVVVAKTVKSPPLPSPTAGVRGAESDPGRTRESAAEGQLASPPLWEGTARTAHNISSPLAATARKSSRRSESSASLALLGGGSLGKSYGKSMERAGWGAPKRTESVASLSGLVAVGEIVPTAELATSFPRSPPPSSFRPRPPPPSSTSIRRLSTSPSSPSSTSSFAHSHSSTRSSQRSTAGSSDHPNGERASLKADYGQYYPQHARTSSSLTGSSSRSPTNERYISSSVGSQPVSRPGNKPRRSHGLMMTPSTSSLSAAGSSYGDAQAGGEMHHRAPSESMSAERTPTQSLSKATSLRTVGANGVVEDSSNDAGEFDRGRHGGTIKRRAKEARALSTPASTREGPATSPPARRPANAAGENPALSYLYPNGHPDFSGAGSGNKARNWSWDHLPVPVYTALDVDAVRREKMAKDRVRKGEGSGVEEEGTMLPPPPPAKERKRLFYFSDAGMD